MDTIFKSSYNETVIAVSENARWEQELLHFSFIMPIDKFDLNFDGYSLRSLSDLQWNRPKNVRVKWHFQTGISSDLRSDTGKMNNSPRSLAKPLYRAKLGDVTEIRIPVVDADGDFIKCELARFVEGGDISLHLPPNVIIHENCTVFIDASESNNYTDNTWIAVPVSVRDYNRHYINYGSNPMQSAKYSLSATPVQFVVHVLAHLTTPEFVDPTFEDNHMFILYAGTTLITNLYAEATENTSIDSFTALGIQQETFILSQIQQDQERPRVKYSTLLWKPPSDEIGSHIACVTLSDNTGVDSAGQRCFILDVQADAFNYTTAIAANKPYFVGIPSPDQFVSCKVHATCVVAIFIKSAVEVTDVQVTQSYIDKYQLGSIQTVEHKGEQMYQVDLSFEHFSNGKESICFMAKDKNGHESENICIQSQIELPDPCQSAPCLNSGTCERDKDTGVFRCLCLPKFSGKFCQTQEDPCIRDPCVKENTLVCFGQCYCKPGFTGPTCAEGINDCTWDSCNRRGSCKDKVQGFDCECLERYNGTNCDFDKCPLQAVGVLSCPADGCSLDSCNARGVCQRGGHCLCPYGFTGQRCETKKCDLSGMLGGEEIISPSLKDGSRVVCYTMGKKITACNIRVYLANSSGSVPKVVVNSTQDLKAMISIGSVRKSSDLPGISTLYTADINISGEITNTNTHYVCVRASSGILTSSACYELSLVPDPKNDTTTLAYAQRNALVKFVQPTLKDSSRMLCTSGEMCHILMYTSFSSNRLSCKGNDSMLAVASIGKGCCGCGDKDNDEDDPDTVTKAREPCCVNVVSSTTGVTVYPAHPRGPSCVAEASFKFTSAGENDICFLSGGDNFQQLCYKVGVYNQTSDPCSSSPCFNNGHCFHTNHINYNCICPDKYVGDRCERGPCQPADNHCQNDAYCQMNKGVATCICKAGFSGLTCNRGPSSLQNNFPEFTDTAHPTIITCVIFQQCGMTLILTGSSGHIPIVSPGYVDTSLLLEQLETTDRLPIQNSYQTNVQFKPVSVGIKDICFQTKDVTGVNRDEICFKVRVISDFVSIYGLKDRPHFVDPSLPTGAEVECPAGGPCHILYHATVGKGNENKCMNYQLQSPDRFVSYHLFSSCDDCKHGGPGNINCTLDVSLNNGIGEVNVKRHFCLSLGHEGSATEGETRCFNLTLTDPVAASRKRCQYLECRNGGFCDGHIPSKTLCFCVSGFSGSSCETANVRTVLSGSQIQSFFGELAVPSEIKCSVNEACHIPFEVVSNSVSIPKVLLGYIDAGIAVSKPTLKSSSDIVRIFEGYVTGYANNSGIFRVCIQTSVNSKTEDEMCVTVQISSVAEKTGTAQPYFVTPTVPTYSTVLCEVNQACHLSMHFTKGDIFGFPGKCPTIRETSPSPVQRVHIFEPVLQVDDCVTDVSYIPQSADVERTLCVQVALPGRKGENRCIIIKSVLNMSQAVLSPCRGKTCANGGQCIANLSQTPYNIQCVCPFGQSANVCNTGDNCSTTCLNGGTCINGICHCEIGVSGDHCERVLDPCSSNPCLRGTCFHHVRQYHCVCPSGFTGKKCELNIDECLSQPCLNGGKCIDNIGSFMCNCSSGFAGSICETDINECVSQPCLNGGFCKDSIDQFVCQCRTGFDGDRCENVVDPCMKNPCVRGTCFTHVSQFICECPSGYTGKLCDISIQLSLNGPVETYLKVPLGSAMLLNCSVSGLHPPNFSWTKLRGCDSKYESNKASTFIQSHATLGDSGTYICTASDGHSANVSSYFHVEITPSRIQESCNFDDGTICGWSQQTNDSFDWALQNGKTQSDGTGPDADHTLGTSSGKYLYIESSAPRSFGEYANLISPILPANRTICFEFWYYMFGDGTGRLFVLLLDTCLKKETQMFKQAGDQGQGWTRGAISVSNSSIPNDYRIVIKADVGATFHGDTSIDDLVITDGPCKGSQGVSIVG